MEIAWRLFQSSPWLGTGLGYFIEFFPRVDGSNLIIHSTYLWLLAEFGLIGFAVFGASALGLLLGVWRRARIDDGCRLVVLLLAGLGTMSLVHDLLFQRMAYFALGLALACNGLRQRSKTEPQ
jgi:O-antigen ligase